MSASMRPVKSMWGPSTDMFINDPDRLLSVLRAATGLELSWDYEGDFCKINIPEGKRFLDALVRMDIDRAVDLVDPPPGQRDDVVSLLGNLKALAPEWASYIDDVEGWLEIWAD